VAKIRFLSTAKADLAAIRLHSVREFGGDVADAYFLGFKAAFALLREHPHAGPTKSELGSDIRCFVHRRHLILYSVEGDIVLVRRIVHHAQDARRALN
jgi:toxin ParE1/3/4